MPVTLQDIPTLHEEYEHALKLPSFFSIGLLPDPKLNSHVSLWRGNIVQLQVDAIVNANNSSLRATGVDLAINQAAGPRLREACCAITDLPTATVFVTPGFNLPAKYVIHIPGPTGENVELLKQSYIKVLNEASQCGFSSIAFCCISAGARRYPSDQAAQVAIATVRRWLSIAKTQHSTLERVIFCVYTDWDEYAYKVLLPVFFPA